MDDGRLTWFAGASFCVEDAKALRQPLRRRRAVPCATPHRSRRRGRPRRVHLGARYDGDRLRRPCIRQRLGRRDRSGRHRQRQGRGQRQSRRLLGLGDLRRRNLVADGEAGSHPRCPLHLRSQEVQRRCAGLRRRSRQQPRLGFLHRWRRQRHGRLERLHAPRGPELHDQRFVVGLRERRLGLQVRRFLDLRAGAARRAGRGRARAGRYPATQLRFRRGLERGSGRTCQALRGPVAGQRQYLPVQVR